MNKSKVIQSARQVLNIEALAIKNLAKKLDNNFYKVVNLINSLKGKLIISGVGKSGNIAAKIAASFTSTGIPSIFLNPVDASHGDMGIITPGDILIILSNSGESHELNDLIDYSKKQNIKIISICSNKKSSLSKTQIFALLYQVIKKLISLALFQLLQPPYH